MTQDDLAKQAGVTRHTIMALAGKYFPSLLLAFRIARAFASASIGCSSTRKSSNLHTDALVISLFDIMFL